MFRIYFGNSENNKIISYILSVFSFTTHSYVSILKLLHIHLSSLSNESFKIAAKKTLHMYDIQLMFINVKITQVNITSISFEMKLEKCTQLL